MPLVLIIKPVDLICDISTKDTDSSESAISFDCRYADMNGMPLFETSAKDDDKSDHVEAIFITLAQKIATFKSSILNDANIGEQSGKNKNGSGGGEENGTHADRKSHPNTNALMRNQPSCCRVS